MKRVYIGGFVADLPTIALAQSDDYKSGNSSGLFSNFGNLGNDTDIALSTTL